MLFHFLIGMGGHRDGLHAPKHFFCMLIEIVVFVVIIYVKLWFNSAIFIDKKLQFSILNWTACSSLDAH